MKRSSRISLTTTSDRIGDVLVAISQLKREVPDDAKIVSVGHTFSTPRRLEITAEWQELEVDFEKE